MTIYTYLCKDGVWRTRCGKHISNRPYLAPLFYPPEHPGELIPKHTYEVQSSTGKSTKKECPVFYAEKKEGLTCVDCRG